MNQEDTIAAISTPQGIGALAIIRVSGNTAFEVFKKCISTDKKFDSEDDRVIRMYDIINSENKIIDEITAIKYTNPKSYTGEDLVEIFCHGGYYVKDSILELLIKNGARVAEKGEFTKRAFINGKIDLMKAESIKAIIESKNREEHSTAIDYYKHINQTKILEIKDRINEELSYIEAEIEFQDEEQNEIRNREPEKLLQIVKELRLEIERNEIIKNREEEITIVLIGPTNAGKSSIFNEVLGYSRAIVSNQHGTTRDVISEIVKINNKSVKLIDTAGIRYTEDTIEVQGQKKTKEKIKETDIVIWVTDGSESVSEEEKKVYEQYAHRIALTILNKADLKTDRNKEKFFMEKNGDFISISVKEKSDTKKLFDRLENLVGKKEQKINIPSIILNQRHQNRVEKIEQQLNLAIKSWNQKEIAAYYVNLAIEEIDAITGKNENEKVLNNIFETFCIGK